MTNRFKQALANLDAGTIRLRDRTVIREALSRQTGMPFYLEYGEWLVCRELYRDWIGFSHLQKLLSRPSERIHVWELTGQPNFQNARKAVQKSVRRAIGEIARSQPQLADHLKQHVQTGESCCYVGEWKWQIAP